MFRINTNLGLRAFENWYYTFDAQLRTQMFQSVNKDDVVTARIFAPLMADAGIGMKYDINKKKFRGDPFQNLASRPTLHLFRLHLFILIQMI